MNNHELLASAELEIAKILNQLELDSQRIVDRIRISRNKVDDIVEKRINCPMLVNPILVKGVEIVLYPDYEMTALCSYLDQGEFRHTRELWFQDWLKEKEVEKNNG